MKVYLPMVDPGETSIEVLGVFRSEAGAIGRLMERVISDLGGYLDVPDAVEAAALRAGLDEHDLAVVEGYPDVPPQEALEAAVALYPWITAEMGWVKVKQLDVE